MIPQSFIADLLNRVDIVDVVGRYVQLKKGGANLMGLCPFHNEKSPSFTVSPAKQFYHCFGCGAHGSSIGFLMEYSGLGYVDAIKELAQNTGMVVPDDYDDKIPPAQRAAMQAQSVALTELMTRATEYYRAQLRTAPNAIAYLKQRGLTGEVAARFALGYAPDGWDGLRSVFPDYDQAGLIEAGLVKEKDDQDGANFSNRRRYDRFRDRIMFPIRNTKGQVIAFGGRVMGQGEPKYLNSPETPLFQKGNELYGLFEARQAIREAGYVLVTEGYMDVVALAQWGFPQAVATLGTACTSTHVQKLLRVTDNVIFSFDGDKAGRRAARRALEASLPFASDDKSIKFLFLPTEHDPDSFVREFGAPAFEEYIAESTPLSQFLLREAIGENDLSEPEGRARTQFDAKPLLQAMPPTALRLQIVRNLAQVTGSSPQELEAFCELAKPGVRVAAAPPRKSRTQPIPMIMRMMRNLIAHPKLAVEIDKAALYAIEQTAPEHEDLVRTLIEISAELGEQASFALLAENLREIDDFSQMIKEIASNNEEEFDACRLELRGAVRSMKIAVLQREMDAEVSAGLKDVDSQTRYRDLFAKINFLKQQGEVEKAPR